MTKFSFDAAINIRAYGSIVVEADTIEKAKAIIAADGFDMKKHWSPHGGGDDDFDWNHDDPDIWLNHVTDEDDNETELGEELPRQIERNADGQEIR